MGQDTRWSKAIVTTLILASPPNVACTRGVYSSPTVPPASNPCPPTKPSIVPEFDATLLRGAWQQYKSRFIQEDGRVIDRKQGGITTSEGQAYALLRSLWMDDRATFERVLRWSTNNLNAGVRPDHLHAWKWGARADGSWGILDRNAATDGDQLIAYALIQASRKWSQSAYLDQALALLGDIWEKETRQVDGVRYVLAGEWMVKDTALPINPSYYMPFAYRVFAQVDPRRGWERLIDASYTVFEHCRSKVGLPTDWCQLDLQKRTLTVATALFDRAGDFGYDACRVFWNLAADALWGKESRALPALRQMDWLLRYWAVKRELPAVVTVDGIPREQYKALAIYGAFLPAVGLLDPTEATLMYRQVIAPSFNQGLWGDPDDYYAQNLVWLGLALYGDFNRP